jgi:hypothetical protein
MAYWKDALMAYERAGQMVCQTVCLLADQMVVQLVVQTAERKED